MNNQNEHFSNMHTQSRRDVLKQLTTGIGGLALLDLLNGEGLLHAAAPANSAHRAVKVLHHPPKVKRVVQLFMAGAASHVDMFDYKPALAKYHGKPWDPGEKVELFQSSPGATLKSPWAFKRYGATGKPLSEVVAPLGRVVDDIAFIHNIKGMTGVHSQGTLLQSTGFSVPGYPSAGSWVSYALGSMNENLPAFVVLPDHRGLASNGTKNWSSMFLPASNQGTVINPGKKNPIADLFPTEADYISRASDKAGIDLLRKLNSRHASTREGDSRLDARIRSYELAARMQLSATEALDIKDEPQYMKDMYGLWADNSKVDDTKINPKAEREFFGRKCLIARRLLERGVRYIQIWSGNDNGFPRRNWDSHENIERDHGPLAMGMAHGTAALIEDLKQRGMLEDTLILWTTEFGRMPCSQGSTGRDHNPFVFSNWMCGGGVKGGTYGESDEWGFKPADRDNPTQVYDVYATMLHLLGIDFRRLSVLHNGIDERLTSVHGHVLKDLLA